MSLIFNNIEIASLFVVSVILVFPANDSSVSMAAQILGLVSWAGFALQELDSSRHRIPALPLCVTQRTSLPFTVHSYWNTSPNAEHSYIGWYIILCLYIIIGFFGFWI